MKVLSIITYYHPHWTGLTSHAVRVAEALADRGHEVTVLTTRHSSALPSRETRHRVEILRLRPIARFSRGMIAPSFPLVAAKLIRRSDVVQIHTPLPEALAVAAACRTFKRPLVMTHHGDVVMPPGLSNQLIEKVGRVLLRKTAGLADAVTSYSRDYAEHSPVLSPFLDRLTPIYPPVDIPEPIPEEVLAWRRELGLAKRPLNLLPFQDESFDRVLMSEVLEHVEDDRRALAEVHRVLRPGGVLAISVPHARYPFLWDPINRLWTALGGEPIRSGPIAGIWSEHEKLYHPAELVDSVQSAGLTPEIVSEATHYAFPFSHFLVYGIGKPLFERNLLPSRLHRAADRFRGEENTGSLLNPVNLGVAMFRLVDRLNDRPAAAGKRTFVNVLLKARKPARA